MQKFFLKQLLFPFFGTVLLLCLWLFTYSLGWGPRQNGVPTEVFIPPGSTFQEIEKKLVDSAVLRPDFRFSILARILGVTRNIKAGEYRFDAGAVPLDVLRKLAEGDVRRIAVTIPEGADIRQIAELVSQAGVTGRDAFIEAVHDDEFIRRLGYGSESLEGYLFPDTYSFVRGQSARIVVRTMTASLQEVLCEVGFTAAGADPQKLHELLVLSSIVEKETGRAEERPLIARVFLNRLEKGMRLQTDPTVIYGIKDFDGNLTRSHLRAHTPYNTYVITGLPPGPICSPGRASIEAVLKPAEGDYLYFVSKNDGTHFFSKTLAEHNRAVDMYQKRR